MSSSKVKGVISLCNGDRNRISGIFKTIDIESSHLIFTYGELAPVAKKIGLNLLALQIPSETPGLNGPQLSNQTATYLMIDTNTGFARPEWQQTGTTLFVRKDKKPLTENHIEALWMFNDSILDMFGDDPTKARAMMNRDRFNRFWTMYKDSQIGIIRQSSSGRDRSAEIRAWETDSNPLDV